MFIVAVVKLEDQEGFRHQKNAMIQIVKSNFKKQDCKGDLYIFVWVRTLGSTSIKPKLVDSCEEGLETKVVGCRNVCLLENIQHK